LTVQGVNNKQDPFFRGLFQIGILVSSLDTCIGKLLREEQPLVMQESMSHEVALPELLIVTYTPQGIGKGCDM